MTDKLNLDITHFVDNVVELDGIIKDQTVMVWEVQWRSLRKIAKTLFPAVTEAKSDLDLFESIMDVADEVLPLCSDISAGDFRYLGYNRVFKMVRSFMEVNKDFLPQLSAEMEKMGLDMNFGWMKTKNSTKSESSEEKSQTPSSDETENQNNQKGGSEKIATLTTANS